jgi:peptide/nickel transport system substrate-binding protein
MRARRLHVGAVLAAVAALTLAACGGDDDDGDAGDGAAGDSDTPVVVGTTDTVTNIDPAGEFDSPSNNIVDSLYEKLLTIPPGGTEPEPQAAESCDWTDDVTYTCTLKEGLQFSDGSELTAEDVVHSFQRQLTIQHESGGRARRDVPARAVRTEHGLDRAQRHLPDGRPAAERPGHRIRAVRHR